MIGGSIVVGACLLVLGWTSEIVATFVKDEAQVRANMLQTGSRCGVAARLMVESRRTVVWFYGNFFFTDWLLFFSVQRKSVTIAVAVLSIYAVDFAINVGKSHSFRLLLTIWLMTWIVQACCRSLIVDTLPIPQQQSGSAWGKDGSLYSH